MVPLTELKKLKIEVWILRIVCFLLVVLVLVASSDNFWYRIMNNVEEENQGQGIDKKAPFHKEIEKILKPLKYSGLKRLLRPDVWVSIDFNRRTWTLHGVHRYDQEGRVLLEEGRYGICQELAVHTYEQIQTLFKDQYDIRFIPVAEAGFFPYPYGSHTGICIVQRKLFGDKVYFLDPTYHRYGDIASFNDYCFNGSSARYLTLQTEHNTDETQVVNSITPLVIRENYLIGLSVEVVGDRFDKNNFVISILATRKYRYSGRHIYALKMAGGRYYEIEDEGMARLLLQDIEYDQLRDKVKKMFERILEAAAGGDAQADVSGK